MRDRLTGLIERAEMAVASCSGVLSPQVLTPLIDRLKAIRVRMSFPDNVLVVALAGGTGSGKSSLLNAMAGDDLVEVSGLRPTTGQPAAAIPRSAGSSLDGYLDYLGISERHFHDGPSLCLIDLPDTDSVEIEHRYRVDHLLPMVDAVVWVSDPEKYRDAVLHNEYIAPLGEHQSRFVFALNQIDRNSVDETREVLADFTLALLEDGIREPVTVPVAAAPVAGPPLGIESLILAIEDIRASGDPVTAKLLTDLGTTARSLADSAGSAVDFDVRAAQVVATAATALAEGDTGLATTTLTGFFDSIAGEVGGPTGARVSGLSADTPAHVQRITSELTPVPTRRWFRRAARADGPDPEEARRLLAVSVIRPVRAVLAKRALALASVAELAVQVENSSRLH